MPRKQQDDSRNSTLRGQPNSTRGREIEHGRRVPGSKSVGKDFAVASLGLEEGFRSEMFPREVDSATREPSFVPLDGTIFLSRSANPVGLQAERRDRCTRRFVKF